MNLPREYYQAYRYNLLLLVISLATLFVKPRSVDLLKKKISSIFNIAALGLDLTQTVPLTIHSG
jgi:hypothetical protein